MQRVVRRGTIEHYGLAVLASLAATSLSLFLQPVLEPIPAVLFVAAVVFSGLRGGLGPGLLTSLLNTLAFNYLILPPTGAFVLADTNDVLALALFALYCVLAAVLTTRHRQSQAERDQLLQRAQAARADAQAAQRRAAFLAEVSTLLTSSLDYNLALRQVAELAVTTLADWCVVDVLEADGSLRRVAVVHTDPALAAVAAEFQQRYPRIPADTPHTLWKVVRPEQPWLDAHVSDERLAAEARDADHLRLLRALGFKSELVLPLVARGRTLGGITLVRGLPERPYSSEDLALAQELARRAALAADNARLYAEAQRLNAELEQRVSERTIQLEQQIAKHERTLAVLSEKERRLAEAQQIARLGSWHLDLAADRLTWSDEMFRVYGLAPRAGITYAGFLLCVHPEDRARVEGAFARARATAEPFNFDHRIVWPDGSVRVVHGRGTVTTGADGRALRLEGTAQDITARHRLEAELLRSHEQLRQLSAHLQTAREEERARIAREIHDELGGSLTGLKMDVARLRRLGDPAAPEWLHQIETVMEAIDRTVQTVRRIATELRPAILDDFGLAAAVEWQLREFELRSGITCHLHQNADTVSLDRDSVTAVFRVFQETLTNVARHANATEVHVRLEQQPGCLVLEVRDNGRGLDPAQLAQPKTFGLVGMRERVRMLDGSLDIQSADGQGTTVLVTVPLPAG